MTPPDGYQAQMIGDAGIFYNGGHHATLIWFGGLHEPFLSPYFLRDFKMNGLFFKDMNFDWYLNGVKGITTSVEETATWLRDFIRKNLHGSIAVAGQSSGGYAALHYSHHIKPDICIAFAPQTHNRIVDGITKPPNSIRLVPLQELYHNDPRDFLISLHLSRSENNDEHRWDDWRQIDDFMHMNNVTVTRHPCDKHATSVYLHDNKLLYRLIAGQVLLVRDLRSI